MDHLSTEEQDELIPIAVSWLLLAVHPEAQDPAVTARQLAGWWSDVVEDCYQTWLRERVQYNEAAVGWPRPPAVYHCAQAWAGEIQRAVDRSEGLEDE